MIFRPRYSLLAFLLFTAAVAGGVKLWRGPHHYVWKTDAYRDAGFELESDAVVLRGWNFERIGHGLQVFRLFTVEPEPGKHLASLLQMYRDGSFVGDYRLVWAKDIADENSHAWFFMELSLLKFSGVELNELEQSQLNEAIQIEVDKFHGAGNRPSHFRPCPGNGMPMSIESLKLLQNRQKEKQSRETP